MLHDEGNLRNGRTVTDTSWQGNYSYSSVVCPRCGKDDQLQRVSTIVDSGTSQTNGVGIGAVVAGAGGRHPVGVATYSSSNVNNLANRLSGVRMPSFGIVKSFLIPWIPITVLASTYLISDYLAENPWTVEVSWIIFQVFVGGFVAIFPSVPLALIVMGIGNLLLKPEKARWFRNLSHMREAYYCYRDDLVVAGDGSGTPEEYSAWCFSRP